MRTLKPGTLPVIMLVVVVAWALFAVTMLTGTLLTAQRIDNRVGVINDQVGPIDEDLDAVVLAVETGRIAGEINKAAKPLTGQFTQVVQIGDGIEADAVSINERTKAINTNVKSINSTVTSINSTVGEINSTVGEIGTNVDQISASIGSVNSAVGEINSSVNGISGSFVGIIGEVRSIDPEAAGINIRAGVVTDIGRAIKADTEAILPVVEDINANAAAIAGSILLLRDIDLLNQTAAAAALPAPGTDVPPSPDAGGDTLLPELPVVEDVVPLPELPGGPVPALEGPGLLPSGSDTGDLVGGLVG